MMRRAAILSSIAVLVAAPLIGCLVLAPLLGMIGLKPYLLQAGIGVLAAEPACIIALWLWARKPKS